MDENNKLIVSLFDYSEEIVKHYKENGYAVICHDLQFEGDILSGFTTLQVRIEDAIENGYELFGIIAQPPCTDFASSGARWFAEKDRITEESKRKYFPFDNTTEQSIALVDIVLLLVDIFKPKFWVMENPTGRINSLVPEIRPLKRLSFDPCDYGDPYTKRTHLYGDFNNDLPLNKVEPTLGSLMHNIAPSPQRANIRSKTPAGFAKAFYEANNVNNLYYICNK